MYVYSTFDGRPIECRKSDEGCFGCRIFALRRTADRMSKIRHPKKGASDVEYLTFDGRLIECRKSDIRRRTFRMSNIRHSTTRPIESKISDPTNKANRIFDIRSDRMHMSNCNPRRYLTGFLYIEIYNSILGPLRHSSYFLV